MGNRQVALESTASRDWSEPEYTRNESLNRLGKWRFRQASRLARLAGAGLSTLRGKGHNAGT